MRRLSRFAGRAWVRWEWRSPRLRGGRCRAADRGSGEHGAHALVLYVSNAGGRAQARFELTEHSAEVRNESRSKAFFGKRQPTFVGRQSSHKVAHLLWFLAS